MKKFFTLVLMLFASLQLFANAEIVIFKGETTVDDSHAMTIEKRNFASFIEVGDKIIVTLADYDDGDGYWQIGWGQNWVNASLVGTTLTITVAEADITKINAGDTYIINFSAYKDKDYKVTQVKVQKNDSYSDLVELSLSEAGDKKYLKIWGCTPAAAEKISDGDLIVVTCENDANAGATWALRGMTWDNLFASGTFDGRDYAAIIESGNGATIHTDGIQAVTSVNASKIYLAKKIYSLSEESDFDFSSVVTDSPVNVKLSRSITASNWSTIVLPFDLPSSKITTVFGAGASVAEFTGGNESTLNFTTTLTDSKMKANQPYAIKVASDFSSKTISNVTIVSAATPTQNATKWDFVGNYTQNATVSTGSYYFKNNALHKATSSGHSKINGFRGYFTYTGVSIPAPSLNIVLDGTITGIKNVTSNEESTNNKFYNLSGQQIEKPTKGIYIKNGKKYIIK